MTAPVHKHARPVPRPMSHAALASHGVVSSAVCIWLQGLPELPRFHHRHTQHPSLTLMHGRTGRGCCGQCGASVSILASDTSGECMKRSTGDRQAAALVCRCIGRLCSEAYPTRRPKAQERHILPPKHLNFWIYDQGHTQLEDQASGTHTAPF